MRKLFLLGMCLVIYGCAGPQIKPQDNKTMDAAKTAIEQAKKDIEEAKTAEAEKYALELLDSAGSKLIIANESFDKKDYEIALSFAQKASEDAKLAKAKSLASKAIEQAKKDIETAKEMKADKVAPDLMKSAEENLTNAGKSFEEKDYTNALDLAKKASENANEAMKLVELSQKAVSLVEQAKKDVGEAKKAGALKHAPELMKSAEENLDNAVSSLKSKDYLKAIEFAIKASDDAKTAKSACDLIEKAYTVNNGDYLWKISKDEKIYGNPFMWPLIYKANRNKIKNHHLIYPAQKFDIPADFSDKDKEEAIDDAKKTPPVRKK